MNHKICQFDSSGCAKLNSNLQEIYDYIKVPEEAWEYLKNWYDYDFEVVL